VSEQVKKLASSTGKIAHDISSAHVSVFRLTVWTKHVVELVVVDEIVWKVELLVSVIEVLVSVPVVMELVSVVLCPVVVVAEAVLVSVVVTRTSMEVIATVPWLKSSQNFTPPTSM
jgi:hypothetical protein